MGSLTKMSYSKYDLAWQQSFLCKFFCNSVTNLKWTMPVPMTDNKYGSILYVRFSFYTTSVVEKEH